MLAHLRYMEAFVCALFFAFLVSGCAGSIAPSQQRAARLAPTEVQEEDEQINPSYQQALNAIEENDYQQAVAAFQQTLKMETLNDADLYHYAHALYQTANYAAAITSYNQYLDTLGRRGDNFLAALNERNDAELKLQQQQAAAKKTARAEDAFSQVAPLLDANWLDVQTQIEQRALSFSEPLTGIEMILVKGGCYQMGDLFGDGEENEQPVHEVCVGDFYLGKHEVTQAQWQKLMGYNPSQSNQGDVFPVESISWQEAVDFTRKLSGATGKYRLPTEAEWEYAARSGGKQEKFSGGNQVDEVAWYEENSGDSSHPVGRKQPNGLGLFDMSGNVYEWCLDNYAADYYQISPKQNPAGPSASPLKSMRGGGWGSEIAYQRTSFRQYYEPVNYRDDDTGFRLALPLQ